MGITRAKTITEQVILLLQGRIDSGEYAPQTRIPSESELAAELDVSRASVRTALSALVSAGLVSRRHGDGTYVSANRPGLTSMNSAVWEFTHLIDNAGKCCSIRGLEAKKRAATENELDVLNLDENDEVISIRRLFYADDEPIIYSLNVIPVELLKPSFEQNELDLTISLDEFIASYCEFEITGVEVELKAVMGTDDVLAAFSIKKDVPLLELVEVFTRKSNQPVVYTHNYIRDFSLPIHVQKPW